MKKLCVLLCMMSYILIAGDDLMPDEEIIPATIELIENKLQHVASLNQNLSAFLLMVKYFNKAPALIAATKRRQFERLKREISHINAKNIRNKEFTDKIDHFLDESLKLFKETPEVLNDEDGKLRIVYTIPHPNGTISHLFMKYEDEE